MTRKRYIKLMMAAGFSRNDAEHIASFEETKQGQFMDDDMKKHKLAHRGCWPWDTYDELLNFIFEVDMYMHYGTPVEPPASLLKEIW